MEESYINRDLYPKLKELYLTIISADPEKTGWGKWTVRVKPEDIGSLILVETKNKLRLDEGHIIRYTEAETCTMIFKKDTSFVCDKDINLFEKYNDYIIEFIDVMFEDNSFIKYMLPYDKYGMQKWKKASSGHLAFRSVTIDRWNVI